MQALVSAISHDYTYITWLKENGQVPIVAIRLGLDVVKADFY